MSLFDRVKSLVEELDHYPYVECVDQEWCKVEYDVKWVNEKGDLYSSEYYQGVLSKDDCVIVNTDNGCGETVTMIFLKDKKLDEDDFYDKYGG